MAILILVISMHTTTATDMTMITISMEIIRDYRLSSFLVRRRDQSYTMF